MRTIPHRGPWVAVACAVGAVALAALAFVFVRGALPPRTVIMATGPKGSDYAEFGERYRAVLAAAGVDLRLEETAGALENLEKLSDPGSRVSIGFVLSGIAKPKEPNRLESLGTVAFEPFWLFERVADPVLSRGDLPGKRMVVGREGSGSRALAMQFLSLLRIDPRILKLIELPGEQATEQLLRGDVDLVADVGSWDSPTVRRLASSPEVSLVSVRRADAFVALNPYLTKVVLPRGVADLARDLPPADVVLVAPKASLVVRGDLHPALQYLLLQAASRIHSGPGIFHRTGSFPAAEAIDIPLSGEAARYYSGGRPFLERVLPFWLWVLAERLLVVLVPLIGIVYPLVRLGPGAFRTLMQRRILMLYGELKRIEVDMAARGEGAPADDFLARLETLSARAGRLHVPLQYASLVYALRNHIELVRSRTVRRG